MRIQKSLTRLAAVQLLYKIAICNERNLAREHHFLEQVIDDLITLFNENEIFGKDQMEEHKLKELVPTKDLLFELVSKLFQNEEIIDAHISKFLSNNWTVEKLDIIVSSILKMAVCELCFYSTPTKVVLDEYTSMASDFYDSKRVGFVNGVLDKISKEVRE